MNRRAFTSLILLLAALAAFILVARFGAQFTASAGLLLAGWISHIEGRDLAQTPFPQTLKPYLSPRRLSRRTGQVVYQFVRTSNPHKSELPMNVSQLLSNLILQGLSKIPNQSAQTQADAQAAASALGTFLTDLAKDELSAEMASLIKSGGLASLEAKFPALSGLLKSA